MKHIIILYIFISIIYREEKLQKQLKKKAEKERLANLGMTSMTNLDGNDSRFVNSFRLNESQCMS